MIGPQLLLVVGYLLLDHLSVALASPRLALLALGLLVALLLVRPLRARSAWAWLLWGACLLLLLTPPVQHWAPLVLMLPATVINACLAWLFGHTLLGGREPLVARMVRLLHVNDAVQDEAVWGYARRVTACWTALFCFNAAVTLGLALLATPGGLLLQLGFVPAWPVPAVWWSYFSNAGCYVLVGVLFVAEFLLRKRLFPWQPYRNLFEFLRRAAAIGPALAGEMAAERKMARGGSVAGGAAADEGGEAPFTLPADHPSLPGHFPGEPVVPGVLLLEAALAAMGVAATQPRALAWVKFLRPLLPAQQALIRWRTTGGQLRFEVLRQGEGKGEGKGEGEGEGNGEGEGEVLVRGALAGPAPAPAPAGRPAP